MVSGMRERLSSWDGRYEGVSSTAPDYDESDDDDDEDQVSGLF